MRIALVSLGSQDFACSFIQPFIGVENVGIHVLAATLRQYGHAVEVIDGVALHLTLEEVKRRVLRVRPRLAGISPTLAVMKETLELAAFAKRLPGAPFVILGGHHATLTAQAILDNEPDVDAIALGEADQSLPSLIAALENGDGLESVPGLALRRQGAVINTGPAEMVAHLDDLPFIARDTLAELGRHYSLLAANIQAARGCPYSCAFCSTPTFYAGRTRYRRRSAENVVEEMTLVARRYGVRLFNFTDDIFIVPNESSHRWAVAFAQAIRRRGLSVALSAMFRSEMLRPAQARTVEELVDAGLHHVLIGIENASAGTLDFFDKRSSLADYRQAITFLREHRVFLACAFINLEPHTSPAEVLDNVRFLRDVAHDPILYHYLSQLTVFPGTPIESALEREGLLSKSPDSYVSGSPYRFAHPVTARLSRAFSRASSKPIDGDMEIDRFRFTLCQARASGTISIEDYFETFDRISAYSRRYAAAHYAFVERCVSLAQADEQDKLEEVVEAYVGRFAIDIRQTVQAISASMGDLLDDVTHRRAMQAEPDVPRCYHSTSNFPSASTA
jgi:radical SAM superfamily enzyme YgiQ (UPF0313 family)